MQSERIARVYGSIDTIFKKMLFKQIPINFIFFELPEDVSHSEANCLFRLIEKTFVIQRLTSVDNGVECWKNHPNYFDFDKDCDIRRTRKYRCDVKASLSNPHSSK